MHLLRPWLVALALPLTLALGCPTTEPADDDDDDSADTEQCIGSQAAGTTEVFASGLPDNEGITMSDDGRMFISAGDEIYEVFPDGSWELFAAVPATVGLAWWNAIGDGVLLVASGDAGIGSDTGGVYTVTRTGEVSLLASGLPSANFITVTPWNTILVDSPTLTGSYIEEVQPDGSHALFADDVPSPNGMAFSPDGDWLYVATTFESPPHVYRLPISDQQAGPAEILATFELGDTLDGVAMDEDGALYVSLNLPGEIARVEPDGTVTTVGSEVDFTASLTFGEGDFDPCSIYSTSLLSDQLFRVGIGVPGRPPLR